MKPGDANSILQKFGTDGLRKTFDQMSSAAAEANGADRNSSEAHTEQSGSGFGSESEDRYPLYWHGESNPGVVIEWRVQQLIRKVGVGLLSGQWGMYKTFIAINLAVSCMLAKAFAGREISGRCGVLFIAAEGSEEIPLRIEAAYGGKDKLPFVWCDDCPALTEKGALSDLVKIARSAHEGMVAKFNVPLGLIIIDTMAASAGFNDEGSAAEAQKVMGVLHRLAKATTAFVMVVDHFGKNVEQGTRGSSAKESFVSTVLAVLGERDIAGNVSNSRMTARKVRGAKQGMEFQFSTQQVATFANGNAETTLKIEWQDSADVEASNPATTAPQRRQRRGWPKHLTVFRDALNKALSGPQAFDHQPFPDYPKVRVIPSDTVRFEFQRTYPAEGDSEEKRADARKKAYYRHLKDAQEQELIGVAADVPMPDAGYRKTTLLWRADGK